MLNKWKIIGFCIEQHHHIALGYYNSFQIIDIFKFFSFTDINHESHDSTLLSTIYESYSNCAGRYAIILCCQIINNSAYIYIWLHIHWYILTFGLYGVRTIQIWISNIFKYTWWKLLQLHLVYCYFRRTIYILKYTVRHILTAIYSSMNIQYIK